MTTKANAHYDAEMAQRLKADNVTRTTGRCPICHNVTPNGGDHVVFGCNGPHRKGDAGTNAGTMKPGGK